MNRINKLFTTMLIAANCTLAASAQTVIKGSVINRSTGETFAGARITSTTTGSMTMSEDNGSFELKDDGKSGVLMVEAPGYEMQYVPVQGRSVLKIKMAPLSATEPLYGDKAMSANSESRSTIMSPSVASADLNISMRQMADVRTTAHSGLDAAGSTMFIGGIHSINMTSQPLFIVDGQIWQPQDGMASLHEGYNQNPLALISPDDIESVRVMKDGTAIWGAKAAGGVVFIDTKRSHNMATEIEVNLAMGLKQKATGIPMMNANDYRVYATDVMSKMDKTELSAMNLFFTDDDPTGSFYHRTHQNTDWLNEISRTAVTQSYNVGVRGGDAIALYAFSLGYAHNDGSIENSDFDRLNVRFNSDIELTKQLKARADISFSQVSRNIFDDGINAYTSPSYLSYIKSPLYSPYQMDAEGKVYGRLSDKDELGIGNPLAVTDAMEAKAKNYRFTAILAPTYTFSDRLSVSGMVGFSWDKIKESSFKPDYGLAEVQLYNEQGDWYGEGQNSVGSLMTRHSTLTFDLYADWKAIRSSLHTLSFTGGFRYINDTFKSDYGYGYNTGSDNLKSLSVTNSILRTISGVDEDWRSFTWYAKADYDYRNKYLLSATATMETNSRFGREAAKSVSMCGVAWGLFPSVTAAWIVSNENFMRHIPVVNYLKIHAGYDVTGRDDLPGDARRTYFQSINYAGQAYGLQLASIGNDRLSWEQTGKFTVGFDARLLDNRLAIGFDYFTATTDNLLVRKQLGEEYGLKSYWANDGQLQNTGFSASASGRVIDSRNLTLNIGATVGHYNNKVKRLADGAFNTEILGGTVRTQEGSPLGVFYGYKTLGVFATQEEADAANLRVKTETGREVAFRAGDMHFVDLTGDGIISDADRVVIGDPNPDIYGNFNFNLRWRDLTLEALFTYSLGADAYNALRAQLENGSSLNNQTENMSKRWIADGQQTDVPRATYNDPMGNARFSDRWIEDASYLKLSQLSLSYRLPVKPRFIQGLTVWVSASNLFTISKYLGSDPEFSYNSQTLYQGIDGGLTPMTRTYNLGIKLNL